MFELVKMRRAQRACNDLQQVLAAFSDTKQQVAANKSAKALAAVTEERFWQQQPLGQ